MEINKTAASNVKTNANQCHLTLNEIADILDLTRERVRQIEAKAIHKLRKKMQAQGIKLTDLI